MNEAQLIPVKLPNILSLQGCLSRARAWVTDLEEIQVKKKTLSVYLLTFSNAVLLKNDLLLFFWE